MDTAVLGDRLPEVTQTPFFGPGSLSLQCWALPALRELESACRVSILWQYPQSAFQRFSGVVGGLSSSSRPEPFASICSAWKGWVIYIYIYIYSPPPFLARRHSSGEDGGGCEKIWTSAAAIILYPPLLYTTRTPRRVFSGVGVYRSWPLIFSNNFR